MAQNEQKRQERFAAEEPRRVLRRQQEHRWVRQCALASLLQARSGYLLPHIAQCSKLFQCVAWKEFVYNHTRACGEQLGLCRGNRAATERKNLHVRPQPPEQWIECYTALVMVSPA